jgi:hypothetical protein
MHVGGLFDMWFFKSDLMEKLHSPLVENHVHHHLLIVISFLTLATFGVTPAQETSYIQIKCQSGVQTGGPPFMVGQIPV